MVMEISRSERNLVAWIGGCWHSGGRGRRRKGEEKWQREAIFLLQCQYDVLEYVSI